MGPLSPIVFELFQKDLASATAEELYAALLLLTRRRMADLPLFSGAKKLYYLSAEFLIGRLLGNNLLRLGLYGEVEAELFAAGKSLGALEELEAEPSLGNGGLGRLAACYLDAIAALGLAGEGIGLHYHLGLFRQAFQNNKQTEWPDPWMTPDGWPREEPVRFPVRFGRFTVEAMWRTIDVPGKAGKNRLSLFDARGVDESIVTDGISFDQTDILRGLTLFLYPDDSTEAGRLLRVYQEYFLVSAAAQRIVKDLADAGHPLRALDRHAAIQINDTHPAMVIPELVRLLMESGIDFDDAADIVSRTCAYTNHTILAEALEKWPLSFIGEVAPALLPILERLHSRAAAAHPAPGTEILDADGLLHMARLCLHYGHHVNGVAALHTEILKTTELAPFYALYPERFVNVTNGVSFPRWLSHANPALDAYLTGLLGDTWPKDADALKALSTYKEDDRVLGALAGIKRDNKARLAAYLRNAQGLSLDEDAVFDVQIKRLHAYKRQQMNALYIIYKYLAIKAGHRPKRPVALLFGAKAAPAYALAKDIIHLLLCLSKLVASDPEVSPFLQVAMVENYNVTLAERLIPAADLSEQISLSSKEASGTGNMKLMLNGAVTLGTLDGANVEIHELVGDENMYLFGETSEAVIDLYQTGGYHPAAYYRGDPLIEPLVDFLVGPELRAVGDQDALFRLYKDLVSQDYFMTLLDTRAYIEAKERALSDYEDARAWRQKSLLNTAMAGFFSAERAVRQYDGAIWRLGGSFGA